MSDRIKKIKIKQTDGTFSDYIPIGANAKDIDLQYNDSNVENTLKKKPYYYDNIATMKLDDTLREGDMAITLGYYEANDGGGAEYKIISGGHQDDGGSIHALNNGLEAQIIIKNNQINTKQFGIRGNGNDETERFQKCLDFANGKTTILNSGNYLISSCLYLKGNLIGEDLENTIISFPSQDGTQILTNSFFYCIGINNFEISNITCIGNYEDGQETGNHGHAVSLTGCKNVRIHNNIFKNLRGDGVYLGGGPRQSEAPDQSTNINIYSNIIDNCKRCAVSFIHCDNITIKNNIINKPNNEVGVFDIEPNNSNQHATNICIENNNVTTTGSFVKVFWSSSNLNNPKFLSIKDNIVECTLFYFGNSSDLEENRTDYVEIINNISTSLENALLMNIKNLIFNGNIFVSGEHGIRMSQISNGEIINNQLPHIIIDDGDEYLISNNILNNENYAVDLPSIYMLGGSNINILNNSIKNTRVGIRIKSNSEMSNIVIKNNNIKTSKWGYYFTKENDGNVVESIIDGENDQILHDIANDTASDTTFVKIYNAL